MKTQKENQQSTVPVLDGQLSLDDILNNYDDGTYGKSADEFIVETREEIRI